MCNRAMRLWCGLLLFALASPAHAGGGRKKSKDLEGVDPKSHLAVIVQFNRTPTEQQHAKIRGKGGVHLKNLRSIKGGLYRIPARLLSELENDPDVVYVSPDRGVRRSLDRVVTTVNAVISWGYGWDGTGIGVAIVDSGVDLVSDLNELGQPTSRVVYSESFVPGESSTDDGYGHGTHVAGIVAGNGQTSAAYYRATYRGIAPNAKIINLRTLKRDGSGTDSSVIAAIDRAIQLKDVYNIRVLNLSLGRPVWESYKLDPLCQAAEAAWRAGIVVVAAAGNSGRDNSLKTRGYGTIAAPGNDPLVITVGASAMHSPYSLAAQKVASYSSKGPTLVDHIVKPDLVAPGNRIVSLLAPGSAIDLAFPQYDVYACDASGTDCTSTDATASYLRLSGTSMAAPVVSAAAALLLQKNPALTPDQVKASLMKTAWKGYGQYATAMDVRGTLYSLQHDIFTVGAGYLDIASALEADVPPIAPGGAGSPQAVLDPLTGTVGFVQDASLIWSTSLLLGESVVWGTSLFEGQSVVWGAALLPGADGQAIVWGDCAIWGPFGGEASSIIWGTSIVWSPSAIQSLSDGDEGDAQ